MTTAFPKPQELRQRGERVEGETYVVRKQVPGVHLPESMKPALQPHRYGPAVDEAGNRIMAYIPVAFDAAENQYPKMLYHPDWGKKPEPTVAEFARGASTPEQYAAALDSHAKAKAKWQQANRTRIAEDAEREAELRKIGWVDYKDLKHLQGQQKQAESDAL